MQSPVRKLGDDRERRLSQRGEDTRVAPGGDGLRRGAIDFGLAAVALVLIVLGLLFVLSSSSYTSGLQNQGDYLKDFRSQLMWAGVGMGGLIFMALFFDYRFLRHPKLVWAVFTISLLLLLLVKILPTKGFILTAPVLNGSQRWIHVKSGDTTLISIQPSEIAKFALILFLSVRLANRTEDIRYFTRSILPCMLIAGVFFALVMWQPNLSTAGTLMIVTIIMLFAAGVSIKQLFAPVLALVPLVAGLVVMAPYRMARWLSFLDPWSDTTGDPYQLIQSFYALANGGLFGTGFGMSRQKYSFLPYASSDFIFAIVGEEVGLIGSIMILALFLALIYFGYRVAIRCPDRFGCMLATGITSLIAVQVVINILVVTGSMPTTGLPLPFFTAGGTSLAIFMCEIGILLNISRIRTATAR